MGKDHKSFKEKRTIAIIGDWFIDEYWLLTRQHLYHSSAPGDVHFIARQTDIGKKIVGLCGAAAILSILRAYCKENFDFDFWGFGAWNFDDENILKCVLCERHTDQKLLTPYTLTSLKQIDNSICPYDNEICKNVVELNNMAKKGESPVSTNRIIRCFEGHGGSAPHLNYRIDWRLPIEEEQLDENVLNKLNEVNLHTIIIEDHGYGLVNTKIIRKLKECCKKQASPVHWFVRSKLDKPKWLNELSNLKNNNILYDIRFADFKVARYSKGERRWWHGKYLSRAALEVLGELLGAYYYKGRKKVSLKGPKPIITAFLLDNNTFFAAQRNNRKDFETYGISNPPGPSQLLNINRSTVCFLGLIAQQLDDVKNKRQDFGKECYKSLNRAYTWSLNATNKWRQDETLLYTEYDKALSNIAQDKSENCNTGSLKTNWEQWNASSKELGIINISKDKQVLQLWRGEGTLKGYISVGGPKRDAINRLVSKVAEFNQNKNPLQSFCCLLVAAPGWGKSHLAHCLAKYCDMHYLEFSIAQMAKHDDLIDCFGTISSVQASTSKRTLVFLDEVNASIAGSSAIDLLLSPIWEGTYFKSGNIQQLKPCVWVFASTERIKDLSSRGKGSDFVSRLNGPIVQLDVASNRKLIKTIDEVRKLLKNNVNLDIKEYKRKIYKGSKTYQEYFKTKDDVLKTDQVYLFVKLLNTYWGTIAEINRSVLELFHDILAVNGVRSMHLFASKFFEVERGRVMPSNVPDLVNSPELRSHIVVPEKWLDNETRPTDEKCKNQMVEIETEVK